MLNFKDALRQMVRDMRSQKLRTMLTVFGIVWGTVAVTLLGAFGQGLHKQMIKNSAGLGDRIAIAWPSLTSIPFEGLGKGRRIRVREENIDAVRREAAGVAAIPDVEVVGDPVDRLPHLVTFSCLYVEGEALVLGLDQRGYGVASGSACTASTLTPSHVLAAMGALTHGNVRLSLTRDASEAEVEGFLRALPDVVRSIRSEVGM